MSDLLEYQMGHDYGVGVYSVDGSMKGDGVIRTEPDKVEGAEGQKAVFFMEQIESTEELTELLGASADMNARFGLFSASANFDFARSISMNSYSLFVLVSVVVTNSFRQMRDVRVTADVADLWRGGKVEELHKRYGDGYVHGLSTGGVYHAILQIDTVSNAEKETIAAELSAGYGAFGQGVDISAQFNHSLNKVASKKNLKVRHLQIGGSDPSIAVESGDMISKAANFPSTVAGRFAAPFQVMTKSYLTVSNLPAAPNLYDFQLANDTIAACGRLRLRYLGWLNDIEYVTNHTGQFVWRDQRGQIRRLDEKADALRNAITGLARQASVCADNISKCEMPSGSLTVVLEPDLLPDRKGGRAPKRVPQRTPPRRTPVRQLPPHILRDIERRKALATAPTKMTPELLVGNVARGSRRLADRTGGR